MGGPTDPERALTLPMQECVNLNQEHCSTSLAKVVRVQRQRRKTIRQLDSQDV